MTAAIARSATFGGITTFVVAFLEIQMAAPLIGASARLHGRGATMAAVASTAALASGLFVLLLLVASQAGGADWTGPLMLVALALYLTHRFGLARMDADGPCERAHVVPRPRGGFRRDAAGIASWGTAVEAVKVGAAWLGSALLSGPAGPTSGLVAAVALSCLGWKSSGRRFASALEPSLLYGAATLVVAIHGFSALAWQIARARLLD